MNMSGPPILGCCLRMTRDEVKVEATYHSLYGFLSPGNMSLRVQERSSRTHSKRFPYGEFSGITGFRSAGKVKRTK